MREHPPIYTPQPRTCAPCGREFTANVWNKIYCGECGNPIQLARDAYKERNQKMQAECRRRWSEKNERQVGEARMKGSPIWFNGDMVRAILDGLGWNANPWVWVVKFKQEAA